MPNKRGSRVKINRKAVDQVQLAMADGFIAVGKAIINETQPPDAPPLGEGLIRTGGVIAYVGKKKVGDWSNDGTAVKKPRALKLEQDTIVAGVGYPSPAKWDELGTINQAAKPFFLPGINRVVPRIAGIMRQATAYRIARIRGRG